MVLDGERVSVSEGGNLVIRDANAKSDNDGGEYVCQAINIVGSRDSEPATLQVQGEIFFQYSAKTWMLGCVIICPVLVPSSHGDKFLQSIFHLLLEYRDTVSGYFTLIL